MTARFDTVLNGSMTANLPAHIHAAKKRTGKGNGSGRACIGGRERHTLGFLWPLMSSPYRFIFPSIAFASGEWQVCVFPREILVSKIITEIPGLSPAEIGARDQKRRRLENGSVAECE
jgi:hypothetical protein